MVFWLKNHLKNHQNHYKNGIPLKKQKTLEKTMQNTIKNYNLNTIEKRFKIIKKAYNNHWKTIKKPSKPSRLQIPGPRLAPHKVQVQPRTWVFGWAAEAANRRLVGQSQPKRYLLNGVLMFLFLAFVDAFYWLLMLCCWFVLFFCWFWSCF